MIQARFLFPRLRPGLWKVFVPSRRTVSANLSVFSLYCATAILSVLLAVNNLQLWKADLRTPLTYGHDACIVHMWAKTLVDNNWSFTNKYLGAPGKLEMQDFPLASNLHFAFLKAMTVFTHDPFLMVNLYYLLTFPLIACAALFMFRNLGIRSFPAVVFSLVYCLLPGHLWRGTAHLFLSAYFMIPLFTCMMAWLLLDDRYLIYRDAETGRFRIDWSSRKTWYTLFGCVAVGSDFPYYSFFAVILALFGAGLAIHLERSRRVVYASLALVTLMGCSFAANLAPTLIYHARNGPNPSPLHVTNHPWTDGEIYGLKVVQLLLPTDHHVLQSWREIRDKYYAETRMPSELDAMALGTVTSLGFLWILLRLLFPDLVTSRGRLYYLLGILTVVAVLIASVGGFGTAMNLLSLRTSRTYNRMSMFIALFAVVALALCFDAILNRLRSNRGLCVIPYALLLGMLFVAGWENTYKTYLAPRDVVKAEFQSDQAFVHQIEASVPPGSKIFQFPYISFFSYLNAQGKMLPYDHFRGYLHSKSLRWSFGAMHARPVDQLHARLMEFPLPECVESLIVLDFNGIYLDRFGYADQKFETQLASLLDEKPITSDDGRFAFYSFAAHASRLKALYPDGQLEHRHTRRVEAPVWGWGKGADAEEKSEAVLRWRWCRSEGSFLIVNGSPRATRATIRFGARSYNANAGELVLSGPLLEDRIALSQTGVKYSREIDIPPGTHRVEFRCSAEPYFHPARTLVFMFFDYELIESPEEK